MKRPLAVLSVASAVLLLGSATGALPIDLVEALGFVTGGLTVWLTVKENVWCWPIGIANNVFFVVLFWNAHLFADMGLQVVYIVLSVLGWYWWVRGGTHHDALRVSRTPAREWLALVPLAIVATALMQRYLASVGDAAPFLDASTTVASLVAQYLLTRKYLENWYVWMAADVVYVGLYALKGLPLTAVLYAVFFCLCISGLRAWKRTAISP
ncbi:MAG: nicotinamide riboside transporter PnuC [Candidatus Uhrbacteria bacterium]